MTKTKMTPPSVMRKLFPKAIDRGAVSLFDRGAVLLFLGLGLGFCMGEPEIQKIQDSEQTRQPP